MHDKLLSHIDIFHLHLFFQTSLNLSIIHQSLLPCLLIHREYLLARFDHGIGFSIVKKCNVPTWIIRTTADTTGDLDEGAFGKNAVLGSENRYI